MKSTYINATNDTLFINDGGQAKMVKPSETIVTDEGAKYGLTQLGGGQQLLVDASSDTLVESTSQSDDSNTEDSEDKTTTKRKRKK